ncbi:hypothetical protein Tco_0512798 [Tanacetum coccineum]
MNPNMPIKAIQEQMQKKFHVAVSRGKAFREQAILLELEHKLHKVEQAILLEQKENQKVLLEQVMLLHRLLLDPP